MSRVKKVAIPTTSMNVLWNHIQRRMGHPANIRVARVDYHEPVKNICKKLLETGDTYLKHRTYVDNVSTVFPERKSVYYG